MEKGFISIPFFLSSSLFSSTFLVAMSNSFSTADIRRARFVDWAQRAIQLTTAAHVQKHTVVGVESLTEYLRQGFKGPHVEQAEIDLLNKLNDINAEFKNWTIPILMINHNQGSHQRPRRNYHRQHQQQLHHQPPRTSILPSPPSQPQAKEEEKEEDEDEEEGQHKEDDEEQEQEQPCISPLQRILNSVDEEEEEGEKREVQAENLSLSVSAEPQNYCQL